jgi:hypothetical protein
LYKWTIVAPNARTDFALPNLRELEPGAALPGGSMRIFATYAHIDDFDYGALRYRQLAPRGWNAYAVDTFLTQN